MWIGSFTFLIKCHGFIFLQAWSLCFWSVNQCFPPCRIHAAEVLFWFLMPSYKLLSHLKHVSPIRTLFAELLAELLHLLLSVARLNSDGTSSRTQQWCYAPWKLKNTRSTAVSAASFPISPSDVWGAIHSRLFFWSRLVKLLFPPCSLEASFLMYSAQLLVLKKRGLCMQYKFHLHLTELLVL